MHIEKITNAILENFFDKKKSHSVQGLNLMMSFVETDSQSPGIKCYEYNLLNSSSQNENPIATIRIEVANLKQFKELFTTIAITHIKLHRGTINSKSTDILAAAIGSKHGQEINKLLSRMSNDSTLHINLLLDMDKNEKIIQSYWEFESAIEKSINLYQKMMKNGPIVKIKSEY